MTVKREQLVEIKRVLEWKCRNSMWKNDKTRIQLPSEFFKNKHITKNLMNEAIIFDRKISQTS